MNATIKELAKVSLVYVFLCIGLIWVALVARQQGDLFRAWILVFTSNIITIIYLFGFRNYIKKLQGEIDERTTKQNRR